MTDQSSSESGIEKTQVPVDMIFDAMDKGRGIINRSGNNLFFDNRVGNTTVKVEPVHVRTVDGMEITDIVKIETLIPDLYDFINERLLAEFNRLAALSSIVRSSETGQLSAVSRLSVYSGDDDAWRLYVPMIALSGLLHVESLLSAIRGLQGEKMSLSNVPECNDPCRWGEDEFMFAEDVLSKRNILAFCSNKGMTAELPWEPGSLSAMTGDKTSLLRIQSEMPHPALGNGLFIKLELPLQFDCTSSKPFELRVA